MRKLRKILAALLLGTWPHCPTCGKRFSVGCEPDC
jgi:hypothetical protein